MATATERRALKAKPFTPPERREREESFYKMYDWNKFNGTQIDASGMDPGGVMGVSGCTLR